MHGRAGVSSERAGLKGAKPQDIPFHQSTKFQPKSAKSLGHAAQR